MRADRAGKFPDSITRSAGVADATAQDSSFLAIFPYGARHRVGDCDSPDLCLELGAAMIVEAGRLRREVYVLKRAGKHWRLSSRIDENRPSTLAYVPCTRLPESPAAAGREALRMVWELRVPARLRLHEWLSGSEPGSDRRRAPGGGPDERPVDGRCLIDALQAEGLTVHCTRGPMGTTEHLVLLSRLVA